MVIDIVIKMQQNLSSKDSVEPQWRCGGGGRINLSSRHSSHGKHHSDGAGAKIFFRKENGPKQVAHPSTSTSQKQIKTKDNALVFR